MKPLVCSLPYPKIDDGKKDIRSAKILCFAYTTQKGELNSALKYLSRSLCVKDTDPPLSDTLLSIALAEAKHISLLFESIKTLGLEPPHAQIFPKTIFDNTTTTLQMVRDAILGEMNTIAEYNKMLFVLKNDEVKQLVERLILDEELHLQTLKKLTRA